jgi:cytochrome c
MKVQIAVTSVAGLLWLASSSANAAIDDAKAAELMKTGGCIACHTVDKKLVGPAYKDVAAKRKGEADALATMEKAVRAGSKGVYSPVPMVPTPASKLGDDDLRSLLQWVLSK